MILAPRNRELILFKTYANLNSEASRTYLSFLWWIIDPVLTMLVFYIVFGVLLQRGTKDYVPFLLIGLTIWQWFANTINHGKSSILENRRLMEQVHLQKAIFPSIIILMDLFKFLIVFALIIVFLWIYGFGVNITYLALPALILVQFLLISAFTYFLAAIVPFIPDLKFLIPTLIQLVFFLTGIFFPSSSISEENKFYFYLNPMANLIEDYRNVLMYGLWPDWYTLGLIGTVSLVCIFFSLKLINRYDYIYPRIEIQ